MQAHSPDDTPHSLPPSGTPQKVAPEQGDEHFPEGKKPSSSRPGNVKPERADRPGGNASGSNKMEEEDNNNDDGAGDGGD